MLCDILKSFPYSLDGLKTLQASQGDQCEIPDALVPGLEREGYAKPAGAPVEAKAQSGAPENKAIETAPENKGDDMAELRVEYERVIGKKPFMGWDADTLRQKITEAKG